MGVLIDGPFAVAHTLSISWDAAEVTAAAWAVLKLCNHWQLTADYEEDSTTLYLRAWSEPIPVSPHSIATALYQSEWDMDDPEGVRFFMRGAKRHGLFVLIPAIDCRPDTMHRPIVAFLKTAGGIS